MRNSPTRTCEIVAAGNDGTVAQARRGARQPELGPTIHTSRNNAGPAGQPRRDDRGTGRRVGRRRTGTRFGPSLLRPGLPAGPVLPVDEAVGIGPCGAREDGRQSSDGYRGAGHPIKLSRTPGGFRRKPPRYGEHGDEVLAEHGDSGGGDRRTARGGRAGDAAAEVAWARISYNNRCAAAGRASWRRRRRPPPREWRRPRTRAGTPPPARRGPPRGARHPARPAPRRRPRSAPRSTCSGGCSAAIPASNRPISSDAGERAAERAAHGAQEQQRAGAGADVAQLDRVLHHDRHDRHAPRPRPAPTRALASTVAISGTPDERSRAARSPAAHAPRPRREDRRACGRAAAPRPPAK